MRYEIQFLNSQYKNPNSLAWTRDSCFNKLIDCQNNNELKIISSLVSICNDFPEAVSRHNMRIFDNYIYNWIVMTMVADQFEAYVDPICIIWNNYLPKKHPFLKFRK